MRTPKYPLSMAASTWIALIVLDHAESLLSDHGPDPIAAQNLANEIIEEACARSDMRGGWPAEPEIGL